MINVNLAQDLLDKYKKYKPMLETIADNWDRLCVTHNDGRVTMSISLHEQCYLYMNYRRDSNPWDSSDKLGDFIFIANMFLDGLRNIGLDDTDPFRNLVDLNEADITDVDLKSISMYDSQKMRDRWTMWLPGTLDHPSMHKVLNVDGCYLNLCINIPVALLPFDLFLGPDGAYHPFPRDPKQMELSYE